MRRVLITGITGQDGSYLAEQYLSDGWEVHGIVRRSSTLARPRIDHLFSPDKNSSNQSIKLHYGDLSDCSALIRIMDGVQPEHVVNLGAQSHVGVSFEVPLETGYVTGLGAAAIFEAVRIVDTNIKVYQASSSEMFLGGEAIAILMRIRLLNPRVLMPRLSYMPITWQRFIGNLTECISVMAFSLITNPPAEAKILYQRK